MFNFSNKRKILKLQNSNLNIKSYRLILGSYFFHLKPVWHLYIAHLFFVESENNYPDILAFFISLQVQ